MTGEVGREHRPLQEPYLVEQPPPQERVGHETATCSQVLPDPVVSLRPQALRREHLQFVLDPQELVQVGLRVSLRHPFPSLLNSYVRPARGRRRVTIRRGSFQFNRWTSPFPHFTFFYPGRSQLNRFRQ